MRCVVVGTSGSGKSTFARELARCADLKYVELDHLHWGPDWSPRSLETFERSVRCETDGQRWVVDGNYGVVRDALWPRATHVVWLNFSRPVVFYRIFCRTLRRALWKERLWSGNRESIRQALFSKDSALLWSLTSFPRNRVEYAALRAGHQYRHLKWIEFRSPAQARNFIAGHEHHA